MHTVDIILGIPLIWGFIRGYWKGIIGEIAGLVAIILAAWGWALYSEDITAFFRTMAPGLHTPLVLAITSFIIFIAVIFIIVRLISSMFERLAKNLNLGFANKIAGGMFGLLKWAFLMSVFIYLFTLLNQRIFITREDKYNNSRLYEYLSKVAPITVPKLSKPLSTQ